MILGLGLWAQPELENLGIYPTMSMPLITRIEQMQFNGPCLWLIKNTKNETIFVRYNRGELVCRKDSQFNGEQFFVRKSKDKFPSKSMDTQEMLKYTKFKLDHSQFFTSKEISPAREAGQTSSDLFTKGKDHVQGLG